MHAPSTSSTPSAPRLLQGWRRVLVWAVVAAVLAAVFALYLQPDFMVTLANQVWACF